MTTNKSRKISKEMKKNAKALALYHTKGFQFEFEDQDGYVHLIDLSASANDKGSIAINVLAQIKM